MPIRMKTKFIEIVVLKPGRRIFIAEATIASAKNRKKRPRFSGFQRVATTINTAMANCADYCDVGLAWLGIFCVPPLIRLCLPTLWIPFSQNVHCFDLAAEVFVKPLLPQTTELPQTTRTLQFRSRSK